ncbi:hypothetical protein GU335_05935 [Pseudolactococcus raffinolactis]|uniref:hypothetical protein n=1 Tax=Pseudolactococcus raffinolactis TaxID=1366 RepID=UPI001436E4E2|nr:hypothetical protein [Lactococcus raffinolactis]QIW56172.1 hypothetical protein GU335_05935 [Lactococcus raffinolactis]
MNKNNHGKNDYDDKLKNAIDKQYKLILVESGKNMTINSGKLSFAHYIIFSTPLYLFLIWLIMFYCTFL